MTSSAPELIPVPDPPSIPGLLFRHFRGESDYPSMVAVVEASAQVDKIERADTVETTAEAYAHLVNCDPYQDMIFAEVDGRVIGYSRGFWWQETGGPFIYALVGFLVPAWRRKGIGRVMLRWLEARLRETAAGHEQEQPKFFQVYVEQGVVGLEAMLAVEGYKPVRYSHEMVRPSLDDIPDFPLPAGLEVRPVLPEHYRRIWDANDEAFRDHWGYSTPTEEEYQEWLADKVIFQPDLWQIAWDVETGEVAGQVKTFIYHAENEKYGRRRGYTEGISVRRPYRRRGLARALISLSLLAQKERGMTESTLGVDSENTSGATRVYEDCGFRTVKRNALYRKPL
jgi:GNAT superfamily N-acetyltransferase